MLVLITCLRNITPVLLFLNTVKTLYKCNNRHAGGLIVAVLLWGGLLYYENNEMQYNSSNTCNNEISPSVWEEILVWAPAWTDRRVQTQGRDRNWRSRSPPGASERYPWWTRSHPARCPPLRNPSRTPPRTAPDTPSRCYWAQCSSVRDSKHHALLKTLTLLKSQ